MAWTAERRRSCRALGTALLAVGVGAARAEPAPPSGATAVLGDSIGVGLSLASGVPRLAHDSVTIRSADAVRQIGRLPPDALAVLSLGTNDAVGSLAGVDKGIDRILRAAQDARVRLVWVGPPCVFKGWNTNVQRLDAILRARLADRVPYVSIADAGVCDRRLRAGDGVHFTMKGYAALWARAGAALSGEARRDAAPVDGASPAAGLLAALPSR